MIAYIDCVSGVAGDMLLGALVDAGWPAEGLAGVVDDLGLAGRVEVAAERVTCGPLAATRVHVRPVEEDPPHRRLPDIRAMLEGGRLAADVAARAFAVFERLAEAEAEVHGTTPDEVHFHEVGALDAVVDITGTVAGLAALGVTAVGCSPLPLGDGWTRSAHGPLPLPAPATLRILAAAGAPTVPAPGPEAGELVTPTGAALVAELARFERPPMTLRRVGYGAGGRDTAWPNVLRLWLGEPVAETPADALVLIETNLDDMVPELFGHVMDRLFVLGALDVYLTPVQMKKSRPGTMLSVLAPAALEAEAARLLLEETTTLGLRVQPVRRHVAPRGVRYVATRFGTLPVKVRLDGERVGAVAPEYEACRAAAIEHGAPLPRVYAAVLAAAEHARESGAWLAPPRRNQT